MPRLRFALPLLGFQCSSAGAPQDVCVSGVLKVVGGVS